MNLIIYTLFSPINHYIYILRAEPEPWLDEYCCILMKIYKW